MQALRPQSGCPFMPQVRLRLGRGVLETPVSTGVDFARRADISSATASRLLDVLCKIEILKVVSFGGGRSPKVFIFDALLDIAEGN